MRRGGLPLKVKVVEQIFELSEKGLSSRAVADMLHTRQGTVLDYLKLGKEKGIERSKKLNEETAPLKINNKDIWHDKLSKDWLLSYAEGGRGGYLSPLMLFCNLADKLPTELIEDAEEDIKAGRLLRERRYFDYFIKFEQWLKKEGYASVKGNITSVKAFFQFYQVMDLPKTRHRAENAKEGVEANNNIRITKNDIKDMLSVCRYLRDEAIILTMASSGLGSAEIRALTIGDFLKGYNEETKITKLYSKRIKTNKHFITFISPETTDMVLEYLEKERKFKAWNTNTMGEKNLNLKELNKYKAQPLFAEIKHVSTKKDKGIGLSKSGLIRVFKDISRRLDRVVVNEDRTQNNLVYNELRAHNLRKYFNTSMKNAGCPDFAVEYLMGHKVDAVKATYYLRNDAELEDIYLKFMPSVTIRPTETQVLVSGEYKELKFENETLRKELEEIKTKENTVGSLYAEIAENPELKGMFDALLSALGEKIAITKGKKPEVIMTVEEALKDGGEHEYVKIRSEEK